MESKKKKRKMQKCKMHLLKTEKIIYQTKNQDRSELILIEIQSFQTEQVPNGGPYHYQDTNVPISKKSHKLPYHMKFWRHFNLANLAIFLIIYRSKCTKIKCR